MPIYIKNVKVFRDFACARRYIHCKWTRFRDL